MIIYRGINNEMFSIISREKLIHPKAHEFSIVFSHDGSIYYDGSATYGKSKRNAVLGHQIDSSKFRTSGISTTPHFKRAKYYALNNNKYSKGYILEFDTDKLDLNEYELIVVSEIVKSPKIPEDSEIILRRFDNNSIPYMLITNLIEIDEI